jgi:hypothetical protein
MGIEEISPNPCKQIVKAVIGNPTVNIDISPLWTEIHHQFIMALYSQTEK